MMISFVWVTMPCSPSEFKKAVDLAIGLFFLLFFINHEGIFASSISKPDKGLRKSPYNVPQNGQK